MHGNAITQIDANDTSITGGFDRNNRLISRTIVPGPGVSAETTTETYKHDGLGRLVLAQDSDSDGTFAWSSLSILCDDGCMAYLTTNETLNGLATTHGFDGVGNRIATTYPGGLSVTRTFDFLNRVSTISADGQSVAAFSYIGHDRVERIDYSNGTDAQFFYNGIQGIANAPGDFGVRQPVRATVMRTSDATIVDDWLYQFRPGSDDGTFGFIYAPHMASDGALWWLTGGPTQRANLLNDSVRSYHYDSVRRLDHSGLSVSNVPGDQIDYAYDLAHNRVTVTGGPDAGSYTMNAMLPQPADLQVNQYTTTPFDSREYDRNGNLIATNTGMPAARTFIYDFRNRLVAFVDNGTGTSATYRYDCFGRRFEKVVITGVGTTTSRFAFDGRREIEESDSANAVQATFVRGLDGGVLRTTRGGQNYMHHTDGLGNTTALTDDSANVVERYDYADFGQPQFFTPNGQTLSASALQNAWLFRGSYFDAETGHLQLGPGSFEPATARFLSRIRSE